MQIKCNTPVAITMTEESVAFTMTENLLFNQFSDVERGLSKASVELLLGYCEVLGMDPNEILKYRH